MRKSIPNPQISYKNKKPNRINLQITWCCCCYSSTSPLSLLPFLVPLKTSSTYCVFCCPRIALFWVMASYWWWAKCYTLIRNFESNYHIILIVFNSLVSKLIGLKKFKHRKNWNKQLIVGWGKKQGKTWKLNFPWYRVVCKVCRWNYLTMKKNKPIRL